MSEHNAGYRAALRGWFGRRRKAASRLRAPCPNCGHVVADHVGNVCQADHYFIGFDDYEAVPCSCVAGEQYDSDAS